MPQYFERQLRAKGALPDLFAALPQVGKINPSDFDSQIRGRFDDIDALGEQQKAFVARQQQARVNAMRGALQNPGRFASNGQWINPVGGVKPAFEYGHYPSGGKHNAYDFAVPKGTQVVAPYGGKIIKAGDWGTGFGTAYGVQFDNGTFGILGHLASLALKAGDIFTAGQLLGLSGSTGNSTGPHLHFETRTDLNDPSTSFDPGYLFGW